MKILEAEQDKTTYSVVGKVQLSSLCFSCCHPVRVRCMMCVYVVHTVWSCAQTSRAAGVRSTMLTVRK